MRNEVLIAGLGLIGGSIGKALRRRGWHVTFVDPNVSLDDARAAGAADAKNDELRGDLIVLATPVDVAIDQLREAKGFVTTTCSVMSPFGVNAGHPFAGSEKSGLAAADGSLFENRPWFVAQKDDRVAAVIEACGARQVVIDPAEHDRIMALTSHLPQIMSSALGALLADVDPMFIGSGAKSMLRLASSSPAVWKPILDANRENVEEAVDRLVEVIRSGVRRP